MNNTIYIYGTRNSKMIDEYRKEDTDNKNREGESWR